MALQQKQRILSIDILRGLIMIIMALDHVRDYYFARGMDIDPLDLNTTTPWLFFTRWVTHFCAPLFVFLSGISASIAFEKSGSGTFMIKRGLFLIAAEVVILSLAFTFNPLYNVIVMQVVWAIGFSLIVLGLMSTLPRYIVLATGLALVFGHDIFDFIQTPKEGFNGFLWQALLTSRGAFVRVSETHFIAVLYAALPWTGIMVVGFSAGQWFRPTFSSDNRRKLLLFAGSGALVLFVLLRLANIYGDPSKWSVQTTSFYTFLSFINISKYPPSLLYTLITVGTGLILLAVFERINNKFGEILIGYGRVPFFYYLAHFYLIHGALVVVFFVSGYGVGDIIPKNNPFLFRPDNFGYSLPWVYVIWILVVAILYKPCLWYWRYKKSHSEKWWTKYI